MLYSLLVLTLAGPTLWRFPQDVEVARAAAREALAEDAKGHLLDEAALDAYLAARQPTTTLGCLADEGTCPDLKAAAVDLLGLSGEMIVELNPKGKKTEATLRLRRAGQEEKRWRGRGSDATSAVGAAVRAYRGQGFLIFEVTPKEARLKVDGASVGEGPGRYPLAPGEHALIIEAERHRTLETQVKITARQSTRLEVTLHRLAGELRLIVKPAKAAVFIDEMPINTPDKPIDLPPGEHVVRCEAEGYDTLTHKVTIKDAFSSTLKLTMVESEPVWRRALRAAHPDTRAHPYYVRLGAGWSTLDDGDVDGGFGRGDARVEAAQQLDNIGLWGAEIGVGWRLKDIWLIEPLSVRFASGGDAVDARLAGVAEGASAGDAQIESMSRTTFSVRGGARYPRWRLIPYALGGVSYTSSDFDLAPDEGDSGAVSERAWHLNLEVGARYHHTPNLFLGGAAVMDLGGRMTTSLLLNVGWALDLPESM